MFSYSQFKRGWDTKWQEREALAEKEQMMQSFPQGTIVSNGVKRNNNYPLLPMKLYVESSARRTGKTTRLVEAVADHIINGNVAVVQLGYSNGYQRRNDFLKAVSQVLFSRDIGRWSQENLRVVENGTVFPSSPEDLVVQLRGRSFPHGTLIRAFVDEADVVRAPIFDRLGYYQFGNQHGKLWDQLMDETGGQYYKWQPAWPQDDLCYTRNCNVRN